MSDPGKNQNREREEQKEIERVRKPITPALDPIEHPGNETFSAWNSRHVSTQLLFRSRSCQEKNGGDILGLKSMPDIIQILRFAQNDTTGDAILNEVKDLLQKTPTDNNLSSTSQPIHERNMIEDPSV